MPALRSVILVAWSSAALALGMPPRALGAPSTMYFSEFSLRVLPDKQPAKASLAEVWTIEHTNGEQVGTVCFQVSDEAAAARINQFDVSPGEEAEDDVSEEEVTRFVLAVLGARLLALGAEIILPMEVTAAIEAAREALLGEDGPTVMCCDTDGSPLMELPLAYVQQHRVCHLSADGQIVVRMR